MGSFKSQPFSFSPRSVEKTLRRFDVAFDITYSRDPQVLKHISASSSSVTSDRVYSSLGFGFTE